MSAYCDIDRWPLCCKKHRLEMEESHRQDALANAEPDPNRCTWLVEVPSGNPEPDCPADLVKVIECGAQVTYQVADNGSKGWSCEAGHSHWEYGSPNQQAEERLEWAKERQEAF